jgi:hypothetical protein
MMDLRADPDREGCIRKWDAVDIAHLGRDSLDAWLRSRDSIEWPISCVMLLLGHGPEPK